MISLIFCSNQIFFFKKGTYRLIGQLTYANRINKYWGVGNETNENNEEDFDIKQVGIDVSFLRKIRKHFYAGLSLDFYSLLSIDLQQFSQLRQDFSGRGSSDYTVFGMGFSFLWDNRDQIINPFSGAFITVTSNYYSNALGSDFDFNQYTLDFRKYLKISTNKNHVLAFQTTQLLSFNTVPWVQNAALGGLPLRGYFRGRYRDHNLSTFQLEYRSPLLFWKISTVGFAGLGWVYPTLEDFIPNKVHPSIGGGFRIQLEEKSRLNLRFDVGIGEEGEPAFYFGIREAF